MILFITGTNSDVGKTIAAAALAAALKTHGKDVVVAKPVQTGEPSGQGDSATIARLAGVKTLELFTYPEPLSPHLAARRAGMAQPTLEEIRDWLRGLATQHQVVIVEGAGGLLVRLADHLTLADLAAELEAPMIVVTSLGLGSLNAAELTVREAHRQGITVLGLIGGALPADPDLATQINLEELPTATGVPLLGVLPTGAGQLDAAQFGELSRSIFPDVQEILT